LEWLWILDNEITDLSPLKGLKTLRRVSLSKNQISDDQKAMIEKALPNCRIDF
jgi:Leucine-rich repeat (LRR) protein